MLKMIKCMYSVQWYADSWSSQLYTQLKQFKYITFHIFICILHHVRVCYELTMWPAPSWLDSSAGRAYAVHASRVFIDIFLTLVHVNVLASPLTYIINSSLKSCAIPKSSNPNNFRQLINFSASSSHEYFWASSP